MEAVCLWTVPTKKEPSCLNEGLSKLLRLKKNRKIPWKYYGERYKRRNEVERFFSALSAFSRVLLATTSSTSFLDRNFGFNF